MQLRHARRVFAVSVLVAVGAACVSVGGTTPNNKDGSTSGMDTRPGVERPPQERIFSNTAMCGDGDVDPGERCDDMNKAPNDGCSAECQPEADCTCPEQGGACTCNAVCGDRKVSTTESCDDGNMANGDGCSSNCTTIETGFRCRVPGRACSPICGDGMLKGTEQCDDGNTNNDDGCTFTCLLEIGADCPTPGSPCNRAVCGNGMKEAGESCDAGPLNGLFHGDGRPDAMRTVGCSKTCTLEPRCRDGATTRACDSACGNANIETGEECDDGNLSAGDGCSATCTLEMGFDCSPMMRDDAEPCAGGNACLRLPVTYRDFKSEKESGGHPDFFYLGAPITPAVSINNTGFTHALCGEPGMCAPQTASHATANFNKRYCVPNSGGPAKENDSTARCWDMARATLNTTGKPDFNTMRNGGGANAFLCPCQFTDWSHDTNGGHVPGYVDATNGPLQGLAYVGGPNGHPQYRGMAPIVRDANSFAQWYTDTSMSRKVVGFIDLVQAGGAGPFQFSSGPHAVFAGFFPIDPANHGFPPGGGMGGPGMATMEAAPWSEPLLCNLWPYWFSGASFGGAPCRGDQYLFPPSVDRMMYPNGMWITGMQGWRHNFWYTSEARYLFVHTGAFELQFYGDDDLFIYINGRLVLDLGGVHQRLPGRVQVTAGGMATIIEGGAVDLANVIVPCPGMDPYTMQTTNMSCAGGTCDCRMRSLDLGLAVGSTYEIAVFHADRHPTESNYQLTLSGFRTQRTTCTDVCGNSVIKGAEECDDGPMNNDTMYGGCTTMCQFGPHCGDGTWDMLISEEECDMGEANNTSRPYNMQPIEGCTPACKTPHYCGDGNVDNAYGEQCDHGPEASGGNGVDGLCSIDCKIVMG